MSAKNLIELSLKILKCNQKELAAKLKVSTAQISKWKQNEHMSWDMEKQITKLIGIGERVPDVVLWTNGIENYDKWMMLMKKMASDALEENETGYEIAPLHDMLDFTTYLIFSDLIEAGVEFPKMFPEELDIDFKEIFDIEDENEFSETIDEVYERLGENPFYKTINSILNCYVDLYGFYVAYIYPVTSKAQDDNDESFTDLDAEIETNLISLSFSKIKIEKSFAPNFDSVGFKTKALYREWLNEFKAKAYEKGIPLGAELNELATESHGFLGHTAEAESLGFNDSRVHPDIYMNEIITNLRLLHQVLPAICKKLDISDEELKIDPSELRT